MTSHYLAGTAPQEVPPLLPVRHRQPPLLALLLDDMGAEPGTGIADVNPFPLRLHQGTGRHLPLAAEGARRPFVARLRVTSFSRRRRFMTRHDQLALAPVP